MKSVARVFTALRNFFIRRPIATVKKIVSALLSALKATGAAILHVMPVLLAVLALGAIGAGVYLCRGAGPALITVGALLWADLVLSGLLISRRNKK